MDAWIAARPRSRRDDDARYEQSRYADDEEEEGAIQDRGGYDA